MMFTSHPYSVVMTLSIYRDTVVRRLLKSGVSSAL